jgi:hypothetical protein
MKGILSLVLSFWLLCLPSPTIWASDLLVELARPGPWAGVSGLIAYGTKLYLANSQIFVNHNSADIYSYRPDTGTVHFEHRLFSQDAGHPAIIDGLLYWPYEDPRFSTTRGEYEITDGRRWQWRVTPHVRGFHVHIITSHLGTLYALASGWRGRVYRSVDGGQGWEQMYEHPTPTGNVSRLTAMVALDATLYFALTAWAEDGIKLLSNANGTIDPVLGWPPGRSIGALTVFQGQLYAVNRTDKTSRLWHSDGHTPAQPIDALDSYTVYALAATPETLWAVSDAPKGGMVWKSTDGRAWEIVQRLPALPIAITVIDGQVFVGTYDTKRGGALWGPANPRPWPAPTQQPCLPAQPPHRLESAELIQALHRLDNALMDGHAPNYRQRLLTHLLPLASSHDARVGEALSKRLHNPLPETPVPLFGGQVKIPAAQMARWYLLHAIALNGHGRVSTTFLTWPWTAVPNRAEKYLEPSLAAVWAVLQLGQSDADTLAALNTLLNGDLPDWAYGDVLAALQVLEGRSFRYESK